MTENNISQIRAGIDGRIGVVGVDPYPRTEVAEMISKDVKRRGGLAVSHGEAIHTDLIKKIGTHLEARIELDDEESGRETLRNIGYFAIAALNEFGIAAEFPDEIQEISDGEDLLFENPAA